MKNKGTSWGKKKKIKHVSVRLNKPMSKNIAQVHEDIKDTYKDIQYNIL